MARRELGEARAEAKAEKALAREAKAKEQWEVLDSYNVPVFTGTLVDCGTWIDPYLSVVFNAENNPYWPGMDDIDEDRVTLNDDGSYTVDMYQAGGGIGGTLTVRRVD